MRHDFSQLAFVEGPLGWGKLELGMRGDEVSRRSFRVVDHPPGPAAAECR